MAGNLEPQLERLKHKMQLLIDRYEHQIEREKEKDALIARLEDTIRDQRRSIAELTRSVETLKVGTILAPTREDLEHSRAVLSQLVREINKCINDLIQ